MAKENQKEEKRLQAAALRYRRKEDLAPKLLARGEGKVAEKIIDLAKQHGITISKDPDLVTILSKIDIGEMISQEMYEIVAELLVFVYRLKEKWQEDYE